MLKIGIKVDTKAVEMMLSDLGKKQLPFATSRAMTAVARQAVTDIKHEMGQRLDRPTSFTLNAYYAKPAKRNDPTAYVAAREYAAKGRPAFKYLSPQIFGGPRDPKGFENAISRKGLMGQQRFAVPARGATLDGFGNMSRGQIVQLLSRFEASRNADAWLSQKTTMKLREGSKTVSASGHRHEYFVAHERGTGRPLGIWRLVGPGKVVPVLVFLQSAPHYSVRLPMEQIVRSSVEACWDDELRKALDHAIRTARR